MDSFASLILAKEKNTGNSTLEGLTFDICTPDAHREYIAEVITPDQELRANVKTIW
jgi:hypothetical protein